MGTIFQLTSGPLGYSFVLLTIATLGGREAVRAADSTRQRVGGGLLALVMTGASLVIIGIRLANFAE